MRSIAITGVSGYIGSKLLPRLDALASVARITGIDIRAAKYSSSKFKFYRRDVSAPLGDIFTENGVESAVHLAFVLRPVHNREKARQVDVGGTSSFLEACHQAQVKHILYLSSHTVYGAHPDNRLPLDEDSPLRPMPAFQYSSDKAEAERMLIDYASARRISLTILRSCPVIGPNAVDSVAALMFRPPVSIRVSGYDPPIQFVHEDDLVALMVSFLDTGKGGIFNVAGDGEISYRELIALSGKRVIALPDRLLHCLMGFSWALRLQNESPPSGLEFIKYPPILDTKKLKRETGFCFHYSSRDAAASFLGGEHKYQPEASQT